MKAALLCALLLPATARAAAWTQQEGDWQLIAGLIYSNADRSYDDRGNASWPELFQRALLTTDTEYGWNDDITVFVRTETAYVHLHDALTPPTTAFDNAFEGALPAGPRRAGRL